MQVSRLFLPIYACIVIEVMSANPCRLLLPHDVPRSLPSVAPHTSVFHRSYITAAATVLMLFSSNACITGRIYSQEPFANLEATHTLLPSDLPREAVVESVLLRRILPGARTRSGSNREPWLTHILRSTSYIITIR